MQASLSHLSLGGSENSDTQSQQSWALILKHTFSLKEPGLPREMVPGLRQRQDKEPEVSFCIRKQGKVQRMVRMYQKERGPTQRGASGCTGDN